MERVRLCNEDPLLTQIDLENQRDDRNSLYAARSNFFNRFNGAWKENYELQKGDSEQFLISLCSKETLASRTTIENSKIKERLEERSQITDDRFLFSAACYAAKVTMTALGEMFQAARSIMRWLGDCAKDATLADEGFIQVVKTGKIIKLDRARA